eukprot:GEMP01035218.1.p1 GENE.GEMP01035218.1~~GEMP01035218.1.p1  ORF type:complete len:434 (+),score=87.54 GEMP01035218.1:83-1384(+)
MTLTHDTPNEDNQPVYKVKLSEQLVFQKTKVDRFDLITKLNVWGASLGDASLCERMPNLQVLSLSCNHITRLSHFRNCVNLLELYLRSNNIADAHELLHLRPLNKLSTLWLCNNPVADLSEYRAHVLSTVPTLRKFDSDDVNVTPEDIQGAMNTMDQLAMREQISSGSMYGEDHLAHARLTSGHHDSMLAYNMRRSELDTSVTRERSSGHAAELGFSPTQAQRHSISFGQQPATQFAEADGRRNERSARLTEEYYHIEPTYRQEPNAVGKQNSYHSDSARASLAGEPSRQSNAFALDDDEWRQTVVRRTSGSADARGFHGPDRECRRKGSREVMYGPDRLNSSDTQWEDCLESSMNFGDARAQQCRRNGVSQIDREGQRLRQQQQTMWAASDANRRQSQRNVFRASAILLRDLDRDELHQLHELVALELEARG